MGGEPNRYWATSAAASWVAAQPQMDAILRPYAECLFDRPSLPAGARVIDVGCGCGATTWMAAAHWRGARVTGIDLSEPMLQVARSRGEREAVAAERAPDFIHADAATHPLAAGSVDRIISRFGVMFFADAHAAFTHMRRWLKPEGEMVLAVWGAEADNPWRSEMLELAAQHLTLRDPYGDGPGPFSLADDAAVQALCDASGLRLAQRHLVEDDMRVAGDVDVALGFFTRRGPIAAALEAADPGTQQAVVTALRQRVAQRHDGDGISMGARAYRLTLVLG